MLFVLHSRFRELKTYQKAHEMISLEAEVLRCHKLNINHSSLFHFPVSVVRDFYPLY